jgi:hypothetical protein
LHAIDESIVSLREPHMLIRILSTFAMLATMSPTYSTSDSTDDETMGGEGLGGVFNVVAFIGAVVLVVIVVLAILSITGQFESDTVDPVT